MTSQWMPRYICGAPDPRGTESGESNLSPQSRTGLYCNKYLLRTSMLQTKLRIFLDLDNSHSKTPEHEELLTHTQPT